MKGGDSRRNFAKSRMNRSAFTRPRTIGSAMPPNLKPTSDHEELRMDRVKWVLKSEREAAASLSLASLARSAKAARVFSENIRWISSQCQRYSMFST